MAATAPTKIIYFHKCGHIRERAIGHCYLRNCPESSEFNFEEAIAYNIEFKTTHSFQHAKFVPGEAKVPWDIKKRALIAPTTEHGYFSVLWFSRVYSGHRRTYDCGFLVLIALPYKGNGVSQLRPWVILKPLEEPPKRTELHRELDIRPNKSTSCESTLDLGYGNITANLTKWNQHGDDIFALDIVFKQSMD